MPADLNSTVDAADQQAEPPRPPSRPTRQPKSAPPALPSVSPTRSPAGLVLAAGSTGPSRNQINVLGYYFTMDEDGQIVNPTNIATERILSAAMKTDLPIFVVQGRVVKRARYGGTSNVIPLGPYVPDANFEYSIKLPIDAQLAALSEHVSEMEQSGREPFAAGQPRAAMTPEPDRVQPQLTWLVATPSVWALSPPAISPGPTPSYSAPSAPPVFQPPSDPAFPGLPTSPSAATTPGAPLTRPGQITEEPTIPTGVTGTSVQPTASEVNIPSPPNDQPAQPEKPVFPGVSQAAGIETPPAGQPSIGEQIKSEPAVHPTVQTSEGTAPATEVTQATAEPPAANPPPTRGQEKIKTGPKASPRPATPAVPADQTPIPSPGGARPNEPEDMHRPSPAYVSGSMLRRSARPPGTIPSATPVISRPATPAATASPAGPGGPVIPTEPTAPGETVPATEPAGRAFPRRLSPDHQAASRPSLSVSGPTGAVSVSEQSVPSPAYVARKTPAQPPVLTEPEAESQLPPAELRSTPATDSGPLVGVMDQGYQPYAAPIQPAAFPVEIAEPEPEETPPAEAGAAGPSAVTTAQTAQANTIRQQKVAAQQGAAAREKLRQQTVEETVSQLANVAPAPVGILVRLMKNPQTRVLLIIAVILNFTLLAAVIMVIFSAITSVLGPFSPSS